MNNLIPHHFKMFIAQLNPTVGDIASNLAKAREARRYAKSHSCDLIIFTELFISGYPAEDLILKPAFIQEAQKAIDTLTTDTNDGGPGIIIGFPRQIKNNRFNSVAVLDNGNVIAIHDKTDLPNHNEFDEKRLFTPGTTSHPILFRGIKLGVLICEEIWNNLNICKMLAQQGAEIIISINASPYHQNKMNIRRQILLKNVIKTRLPIIYINQVCGQDELVFDGGSFCLNSNQQLAFQMPQFKTQILPVEWKKSSQGWFCQKNLIADLPIQEEADYHACVLGLRDYAHKNGFDKILIGLSGGIDSAICAAIAVDALGKERVHAIMLPYLYTPKETLQDAADCAKALGCRYDVLPIQGIVESFISSLSGFFGEPIHGVTIENLQSRVRGSLLMAISNKSNALLITTGNKSEVSVGYSTLYGDMNGGFNPIKDVYKTHVYELARWRNSYQIPDGLGPSHEVIPDRILTKHPSAELYPEQKDQDTLPPYPILDEIIQLMVEYEMSVNNIVQKGYNPETVRYIEKLLYTSEYKRRQSALGIKMTLKSFGRDRRYPISHKFREFKDHNT
ncbi:NAD synthetase / Glutamine amidotransferase chain of NAD synthetase [Liberibacter crescens BT-1]|uniref:Glutamine-dependent NAD(+) synthetase n=1 Tax=Liberibacter crescens (strain BT-1) TaxID=1215343 RepID=L0EVW7_LIBCB|nr:NAD+ synthase [Liberibacter crescens]AGA64818.1 NAD synthetase / Glutamine amidotransferase chain of NAD synthetase [Liberibacter crescens BT-1]AMC12875.1 NAD synthetase [Liberibacter crescens]